MKKQQYAILAMNTMAISKYRYRILEIYIIRQIGERVVDTYSSLINPRCAIPEEISELTGIDRASVRFEPVFCEVAESILDFLDDAIIVSMDAPHDYKALQGEFKTIGYKFTSPIVSISVLMEMARRSPIGVSTVETYKRYANSYKDLPSAHNKAYATENLFNDLISSGQFTLGMPEALKVREGTNYKKDLLNMHAIERKAGVYYFKDHQDSILYVGKAVRLRDRVRNHFNDKSEKEQNLCAATAKIDFQYTGSNLIAELLESDEIMTYKPSYNTSQKSKTTPYIIVTKENKKGYLQLAIVRKDYSDSVNEVFYNRNSVAKKLMELCGLFNLCPKLCGFHRVQGRCNHDKFQDCPRACLGEEAITQYNDRVKLALATLENDLKNFAIKLNGRSIGENGFVLVREGVYMGFGYVQSDDQIASLDDFDNYLIKKTHSYHTTRIIDSYIKKPRNKSNIVFFNLSAELR